MQSTNPTPNIRICARCSNAYDWRRSSSRSLKMTYCNALCENADLGFTIEALLQSVSVRTSKPPAEGQPALNGDARRAVAA